MALLYNVISQKINISINRLFNSSLCFWTHYDVLKVPRNCTSKEIKDSFIQLSKEASEHFIFIDKQNHPDLNKSEDAHKKFIEINQAYNILSNPQTRKLYDLGLVPLNEACKPNSTTIYYHGHYETDPWKDPAFYCNRDKTQDKYYEEIPYYGIKGVKRVSNLTIVLICLSVMTIGVGLQILAVRKSFTFRRDQMIRRSTEAEALLKTLKNVADENGNEVQLEILKQRFGDKLRKE